MITHLTPIPWSLYGCTGLYLPRSRTMLGFILVLDYAESYIVKQSNSPWDRRVPTGLVVLDSRSRSRRPSMLVKKLTCLLHDVRFCPPIVSPRSRAESQSDEPVFEVLQLPCSPPHLRGAHHYLKLSLRAAPRKAGGRRGAERRAVLCLHAPLRQCDAIANHVILSIVDGRTRDALIISSSVSLLYICESRAHSRRTR